MFDNLEKLIYAGLGAVTMTREHAEKIFDEYVEKGKEQKANRNDFIKDLMDQAEQSRRNFENLVSDQVKKVISNLELATREDIERIEKKIDQLLTGEK